jgi:hypothetical protein
VIFLVLEGKAAASNYSRTQTRKEISTDFVAFRFFRRVSIPHGDFADAEWNVCDNVIQYIVALA